MTPHLNAGMRRNPAPATTQLQHDLHSAMLSIRDHATAATFISDLQALAADCYLLPMRSLSRWHRRSTGRLTPAIR
jgi:hypothetical protein